jgi:hypothetical protein
VPPTEFTITSIFILLLSLSSNLFCKENSLNTLRTICFVEQKNRTVYRPIHTAHYIRGAEK